MNSKIFILFIGLALIVGCTSKEPEISTTQSQSTPVPSPEQLDQPSTAVEKTITDIAVQFVNDLEQKNYSEAVQMFDETMSNVLPADKLGQTWESLPAKLGQFRQIASTRVEKIAGFDTVFVTCEFAKSYIDTKVVFDSQKQITGLWFVPSKTVVESIPPLYGNPDVFTETEVTVGMEGLPLPAILSMPKEADSVPAVVLVHGSGPNDKDETIGPNKPFRDLAHGLATKGIAVLRYDKRPKVYPQEFAAQTNFTVREETIDDALSAAAFLRKTTGIDPKGIFILGHSLGGMLIPRIADANSDLTGFIILAGTTRPLEEVTVEQYKYIFNLDGELSENEKEELEKLKEKIKRIIDPNLSVDDSPSELILGATPSYWLDLRGYKPAKTAQEINRPILVLQGERDYQVTMKDFENWKKALSDKDNVQLKSYPKLNHLFMEGEGTSKPSEYEKPGHVAKYVVDDIAEWIHENH